jgi:hypothetical protein
MDGRSAGALRRARWLLAAVLLVGICLVPGVAAAAPPNGLTPGHGTVTPLVDCVRAEGGGAFTAVLGWSNSGTATEHYSGAANQITPAAYNGRQPTMFRSGVHHGAFTVRIAGGSASWTLNGTTVVVSPSSPACPPSAELPADGNGTGPAIVLAVAGVVGVFALLRAHRGITRRTAPSGPAPAGDDEQVPPA